MFRVKLTAKKLEGIHDGAIQITTDYEVRTLFTGIHVSGVFLSNSVFFCFYRNRTKFTQKVTVYRFHALKTELLRIVYRIFVFISS